MTKNKTIIEGGKYHLLDLQESINGLVDEFHKRIPVNNDEDLQDLWDITIECCKKYIEVNKQQPKKTMSDKTTMHQLEKNLIDELNNRKEEILEHEYPSDLINECADSWIPVYNSDLIEALSSDPSLAYVDDHGLLPTDPGVHDIIRVAIYERLTGVAYEWLNDNEKKDVA